VSNQKGKQNLTAIIKDKKGKILSIGKNSYTKTHPIMYNYAKKVEGHYTKKVYLHAEIDAIIRCDDLEEAYKIEVYRINKHNQYALSKPCKVCMTAIKHTNIKVVGYIDDKGEYVEKLVEELE